jgi:hypothetical protein
VIFYLQKWKLYVNMALNSACFVGTMYLAIHYYFGFQIKIIENLVKIQNDGTLEVDVKRSALIASELSEIDAFGSLSRDIVEAAPGLSKSVPKLKIVILVVGTRGDVQPFIALAKRLQASEFANSH